jgi:hypothetical protein
MARASARDLSRSRKCHVIEQGYLYLHPYEGAEYPDSMVQLAVLLPLMEYADWLGSKIPLIDRLRAGAVNLWRGPGVQAPHAVASPAPGSSLRHLL